MQWRSLTVDDQMVCDEGLILQGVPEYLMPFEIHYCSAKTSKLNKKLNNLIYPHKVFSEKIVPSLSTNCFKFLWLNCILFKMGKTKSWRLLFSNHIFNQDLWIKGIRIVYLPLDCCVLKNSQFVKNL